MECRLLKITVISATGLKDVNVFGKMDVYVVVSLSSNHSNEEHRTPIHKGGGTNPQWGHPMDFTFDEVAERVARLKFKIKAKRTLRRNKEIGEVDVPVGELLGKGGADDGKPKELSCNVRLPSGKTKGVLKFFCEQEAPPALNSAAAHRPPVHGAAPPAGYPPAGYLPQGYVYPSNSTPYYGYPPQGYGYPPAGYGYAAPPPAYQKPPKNSGGGNFVLMSAGKFGGELLIRNQLSDFWESVNDAGYDAGF